MVVLRCTRKLLRRLRVKPDEAPPESSTLLGDWYANVLFVNRRPLVLAVSSRTLLPVLVPARDPASLPARLAAAVEQMLRALGVREARIKEESAKMKEVVFAATSSPVILGTMNDFDRMLIAAPGTALLDEALQLAKAPCGPIGMESPERATAALFGAPSPRRRW
jgi:hypothetical protein